MMLTRALFAFLLFIPAINGIMFSLTLSGMCLSETMFLDQKVIGWYRPNLVLDNKQLFLEIYKETTLLNRHSANVYASNVTFEFETRGEGNYNFCFQEMNNNGHISEAWDGPHYSLVHFAYQIINLHDHHQQQFHEFQEEQRKGDKLAIWAYKTGNLEYALEQVHVDMIKFNQHLRNSVSQLSYINYNLFFGSAALILAGLVARVSQLLWLEKTLVKKHLLKPYNPSCVF